MKTDYHPIVLAVLLAAVLALDGCTTVPQARVASDTAVAGFRNAQTDLADAAEAWLCRGMSIREWILRYGQSTASRDAWWLICGGKQDVSLPGPNEEAK